jgi:hypothetical protein
MQEILVKFPFFVCTKEGQCNGRIMYPLIFFSQILGSARAIKRRHRRTLSNRTMDATRQDSPVTTDKRLRQRPPPRITLFPPPALLPACLLRAPPCVRASLASLVTRWRQRPPRRPPLGPSMPLGHAGHDSRGSARCGRRQQRFGGVCADARGSHERRDEPHRPRARGQRQHVLEAAARTGRPRRRPTGELGRAQQVARRRTLGSHRRVTPEELVCRERSVWLLTCCASGPAGSYSVARIGE